MNNTKQTLKITFLQDKLVISILNWENQFGNKINTEALFSCHNKIYLPRTGLFVAVMKLNF